MPAPPHDHRVHDRRGTSAPGRVRSVTRAPVALSGVALAAVALVVLAACGGRGEQVLTATPLPTVPADLRAAPASPTPTPTPTPTPSPTPTPTPTPGPSEPTDTDQARFVAGYRPEGARDLEHVSVDLGDDGVAELVFVDARRSTERARLAVAHWTGRRYEIVFQDDGGRATRIDGIRVDDVNADGRTEIATFQGTADTRSLSLWQARSGRDVRRLHARRGCADGSHTYGEGGASFESRDPAPGDEIVVDCGSGSDDDRQVYVWEDGAYTHQPAPTETDTFPEVPEPPVAPTRTGGD